MIPDDLDLLIHRYFEGTLSSEDEKRFWDAVRSDPAASDRFVELSELESGLVESLKAEEEIPSGVHAVLQGSRRRIRPVPPGSAPSPWPLLVAAGLFMAAVAFFIYSASQPSPTESARPSARHPETPRPAQDEAERRKTEQARAEWEAERERAEARLRDIERRRASLEQARKEATEQQKPEVQRDVENRLALNETERKEETTKLEKVQEELTRVSTTQAAPGAKAALAVLERVEGEVFLIGEGSRRLVSGQAISPGQGMETRGPKSFAVLKLEDGTRVELGGDSRLEKAQFGGDLKSFDLSRGSVLAVVAKQAPRHSVSFLTPQAEVTVVGTRLTIQASAESTRVEVEEGRVRFRRRSDGASAEISAGRFAVAGKGAPPVARPVPVTRSFQDGVAPSADYSGTQDTTISSAEPTSNFATANLLRLQRTSVLYSTLVRWDVSAIPPGSRVVSAELSFWVTGGLAGLNCKVYDLRRGWEESEATWRTATARQSWQMIGAQAEGDRGAKPIGILAPAVNGMATVALNDLGISIVQSWVNAPATSNFGILVAGPAFNEWNLDSRESATPERRPKLTVTYLPASAK